MRAPTRAVGAITLTLTWVFFAGCALVAGLSAAGGDVGWAWAFGLLAAFYGLMVACEHAQRRWVRTGVAPAWIRRVRRG